MSRKLGTPSTSIKGGVGRCGGKRNVSGRGGADFEEVVWALKAAGVDSAIVDGVEDG